MKSKTFTDAASSVQGAAAGRSPRASQDGLSQDEGRRRAASNGFGGHAEAESERTTSGFADVSLDELRVMRQGLKKEEGSVSYWRRILQARQDLMSRNADGRRVSVPQLAEVLVDAQSSHRRVAALSIETAEALPPLPNLAELWSRPLPGDDQERDELLEELREAEHSLSQYRLELHKRIDLSTEELIRRYRDNPDLALTALRESLPLAIAD